ncbi:hypothetical protein GCM10029992_38230 [Glycomyces albus]
MSLLFEPKPAARWPPRTPFRPVGRPRRKSGPLLRPRARNRRGHRDQLRQAAPPLEERLTPETRTALALAFASGVKQKELARKYEISIRSVKRLIQRARTTGVI